MPRSERSSGCGPWRGMAGSCSADQTVSKPRVVKTVGSIRYTPRSQRAVESKLDSDAIHENDMPHVSASKPENDRVPYGQPDPGASRESSANAWEEWFPAPKGEFVPFRSFSCRGSAQVIQTILESENVGCMIEPRTIEGCLFASAIQLFVEARLVHRARWLLDASDIADGELCFLATGELPTRDSREE